MRLGVSWKLEASWSRLGGILEASRSVLELPKTLLKAMWPDTEIVEEPLVFLVFRELAAFGSLARFGCVLEASWSVLEASRRCLGGVLERLGGVLERLRGVLKRLGAS